MSATPTRVWVTRSPCFSRITRCRPQIETTRLDIWDLWYNGATVNIYDIRDVIKAQIDKLAKMLKSLGLNMLPPVLKTRGIVHMVGPSKIRLWRQPRLPTGFRSYRLSGLGPVRSSMSLLPRPLAGQTQKMLWDSLVFLKRVYSKDYILCNCQALRCWLCGWISWRSNCWAWKKPPQYVGSRLSHESDQTTYDYLQGRMCSRRKVLLTGRRLAMTMLFMIRLSVDVSDLAPR